MNLRNYSLNKDLIAIEVDGQYLDLHNNYDFTGYTKSAKSVEIQFKVTSGEWVPAGLPKVVLLRVDNPSYFEERGKPNKNIDELGFFLNSTLGKVDYQGVETPTDLSLIHI